MKMIGGNKNPNLSSDALQDIVDFCGMSDHKKIENVHKYFWLYDLFDDDTSDKVKNAYEYYRKFKEL